MDPETQFELERQELQRLGFQNLYHAARKQIIEQRKYIQELEKQLEYCNPGILKEVRQFLGRE